MPKVKMVLLGDAQVGKSSLVINYTSRTYPATSSNKQQQEPQPHHGKAGPFADYYTILTVDDKDFELSLWDTNASAEYEHIRPLNFAKTDIFLLCFSVGDASSLDNISKRWNRELQCSFSAGKEAGKEEPLKLLVGLKTDLRFAEPSMNMLYDTTNNKHKRATREQALQVAKEIGAVDYIECSARTGDGVEDVFITALHSVVYPCLHQLADNNNNKVNLRGSGGANVEEDSKDILNLPPTNRGHGRKKRCIIC